MARKKKVIIIGSNELNIQEENYYIKSLGWNKITDCPNIKDFDNMIINLIPLQNENIINTIDWPLFFKNFDFATLQAMLKGYNEVIFLGDPKIKINLNSHPDLPQVSQIFLDWTGVRYDWEISNGDTITISDNYTHKKYRNYLNNLKKWNYCLKYTDPQMSVLKKFYNFEYLAEKRMQFKIEIEKLAWNRYNNFLAFSIFIKLFINSQDLAESIGPLTFLPETDLSESDSIMLILRDIFDIELKKTEPDWLKEILVPGEEIINSEIDRLMHEIKANIKAYESEIDKKNQSRKILKLLYSNGPELENIVRELLKELGANVQEPQETGKEDGWISIELEGKKYFGVLEIKGTTKVQFDISGIRQLSDWEHRGIELYQEKPKGIFIGNSDLNNSPSNRTNPFSPTWAQTALSFDRVAIKTTDLYLIYKNFRLGGLDIEKFWTSLFTTNGIFDPSVFTGNIEY